MASTNSLSVATRQAATTETVRRSSVPQSQVTGLPKAWKACLDGCKDVSSPISKPYILLTEDDFFERYVNDPILETYMHFATLMEKYLNISGIHNDHK